MKNNNLSSIIFTFGFFLLFLIQSPLDARQVEQVTADVHDQEEIQQTLETRGHVRLIVGLDIPYQPERMMARIQVQGQRDRILQASAELQNDLQSVPASGIREFQSLPFLALTTTREGYERLKNNPNVRSIQIDYLLDLQLEVSTEVIGLYDDGDPSVGPWVKGYDGSDHVVVVIDTGADPAHPFLQNQIIEAGEACFSKNDAPSGSGMDNEDLESLCPDGSEHQTGPGAGADCDNSVVGCGHGTHVAGIAVGNSDNDGSVDFHGVAKGADLVPINVFTKFTNDADCGGYEGDAPCARSFISDMAASLEHVKIELIDNQGLNITAVNMSLGSGEFNSVCDNDFAQDSFEELLFDLTVDLKNDGVATIAASGNNGWDDSMLFPACLSSVVSVGNTETNDDVNTGSNIAGFLDLMAPGTLIASSQNGGGYIFMTGTSMSAPHVAGTWALLRQLYPQGSVDDLLDLLKDTGVETSRSGVPHTFPRIQVDAALTQNLLLTDGDTGEPDPEGWRFFASPVENTTYSSMVSDFWTQGFPGARVPGGEPNIFWYNEADETSSDPESSTGWSTPDDFSDSIGDPTASDTRGQAFAMYVYGDDGDGTSLTGSPSWPKTIEGEIWDFPFDNSNYSDVNLTLSRQGTGAFDGFNLAGNPYPFELEWDQIESDNSADLDSEHTLVWDPNLNDGEGEYRTSDNGLTTIPAYQAFWVQTASDNNTLNLSASQKAANDIGDFYGKESHQPVVKFHLEDGERFENWAKVQFNPMSDTGYDRHDLPRLASFASNYMMLYTMTEDGLPLWINSLPDQFARYSIPLHIDATFDGELTLSLSEFNFMDDYDVMLIDNHTGEQMDIHESFSYSFYYNSPSAMKKRGQVDPVSIISELKSIIHQPGKILAKGDQPPARFELIIVADEYAADIPGSIALHQNYPNPFNPSTIIRYELPEKSNVSLDVFDIAGRRVASLVNREQQPGTHQVTFNARQLSSGVYIYRLQAGGVVLTRKLTIIK